jgi:hypothetical protein
MAALVEQQVTFECHCGKRYRTTVAHYDRLWLDCGHPHWALQPKRGGPLVMYPWPGPPLTRAEYAAKYPNED